jgi:hypothetical protein
VDKHQPFTMNLDFFSFWFPLLLTVVPWLLIRWVLPNEHARVFKYWPSAWLLWLAGFAWAAAIQLWNIPIADTDSITTHLIGGAIVAPALLAYVMRGRGWTWPDSAGGRFLLLFVMVNMFGLVNEAVEVITNHLGFTRINISDTWWDLGSNAVGAVLAFVVMELWRRRRSRKFD